MKGYSFGKSPITFLTSHSPSFLVFGVYLVTGPIEVVGSMPGDVPEVEILKLDPQFNPISGNALVITPRCLRVTKIESTPCAMSRLMSGLMLHKP